MMILKTIPYSKLFFYSTIDSSEQYSNSITIYISKDLIIFEFAFLLSGWKKIQQSYQMCQEKKVSRKGENKLLQLKTTKIFFLKALFQVCWFLHCVFAISILVFEASKGWDYHYKQQSFFKRHRKENTQFTS